MLLRACAAVARRRQWLFVSASTKKHVLSLSFHHFSSFSLFIFFLYSVAVVIVVFRWSIRDRVSRASPPLARFIRRRTKRSGLRDQCTG